MTWFKVDDQFPDHPKVVAAGGDAAWLFVCGGCYCARHLTDGLIPKAAVARLTDRRQPMRLAAVLVEAGLWHDRGDSFEMHGYLDYNPSREKVTNDRRDARERQAKRGRSSAEVRANNINPDPTRPDVPTEQVNGAPNGATRAQRIPDVFLVSEEMADWAKRECPRVNLSWQTEKFVDWAKSASGRNAVKKDWVRAWRNWMRSEQEKTRA